MPIGQTTIVGPQTNAGDPTEGAVAYDRRIDVGRLIVEVPPAAWRANFTLADAASKAVPVRAEIFKSNSQKAGETTRCMTPSTTASLSLPPSAARLVLHVHATNLLGICPDVAAGASQGTIVLAFD